MLKAIFDLEYVDFRNNQNQDYCLAPELDFAIFDGVNITSRIREIYGQNKGWCSRFWRGYELIGCFEGEKTLKIDWISEDGRVIYQLVGQIGNDDIINLPSEIPEGSYWGSPTGRYHNRGTPP